MKGKPYSIFTVELPAKRPFQWRVFFMLVAAYFLANLAGIPLQTATDMPVEPVWFWGVATLIAALVLGVSLLLANRTGLGAPLLEGWLSKEAAAIWLRTGLALTTWGTLIMLPFSLALNLNVATDSYPAGTQLVLASLKAGVVEELVSRFFLVTLFVWIGRFLWRDENGRATPGVYWGAIILAALLFGWGHVDARLDVPGVPVGALAAIMLLSSLLGIWFGWLYWKLGIEWAIMAHFAYDAVVSAVLLKVYLLHSIPIWIVFLIIAGAAARFAWQEYGVIFK